MFSKCLKLDKMIRLKPKNR